MEKFNIEQFNKQLSAILVTCKKSSKKGLKGYLTSIKTCIDEEDIMLQEDFIEEIKQSSNGNSKDFVDKLVNINTQEQLIIGSYSGGAYLLPPRYRRFYDKCVHFETEKCSIYFTDLAIERFKKTVCVLDERCKNESLRFVKLKLEEEHIHNMDISLINYNDEESFNVSIGERRSYFDSRSILITKNIPKDKGISSSDIDDISKFINVFCDTYGLFTRVECYKNTILAYNMGNLRINGIENNRELVQKVLSLAKRRDN